MSRNPVQLSTAGRGQEILRLSWAEVCARRGASCALCAGVYCFAGRASCSHRSQYVRRATPKYYPPPSCLLECEWLGSRARMCRKPYGPIIASSRRMGPRHRPSAPRRRPVYVDRRSIRNHGISQRFPGGALLTPDETEKVIEAIAVILEDAEMTADELTVALVDRVGAWAGEMVEAALCRCGRVGDRRSTWRGYRRAMFCSQQGSQSRLYQPVLVAARFPSRQWTDRPCGCG